MEEGDFEQTLNQLETLVTSLENGCLNLADSIVAFETGMVLLRRAENLLGEAQQRIEVWSTDANETKVLDGDGEGRGDGIPLE
jgi:exodeoxyribonuclease VII small subunit